MAVVMMCFPALLLARALPIIAILLDSVPPDVNIISSGEHFNVDAIFAAASFIYSSALTPFICIAEGLPKSSLSVFIIISVTAFEGFVVDELSR